MNVRHHNDLDCKKCHGSDGKNINRRLFLKIAGTTGLAGVSMFFGFENQWGFGMGAEDVIPGIQPSRAMAGDTGPSIPAIDRNVPAQFQTASFAMG